MENTAAAIECKGVTKTYYTKDTETPALRGVDLEVRRGELFMLVGPSGCGKTTLISIVAGILNHDEGTCVVLGEDLHSLPDRVKTAFRGKNVGFVFRAYNLIPTLTAQENVAIPLLIGGMPRNEAFARAAGVLTKVGLAEKLTISPIHLSGGQQQRVAIARALVHNPKIIVCDEPTSSLDQETGHKIMEVFREVALAENRTLLVVTHDARIFGFADRIAQMNDGHIERVVTSLKDVEH